MSFELTDRDKFAVVTTTCDGPMVSYWVNWKDVIGLLSTYNHSGCHTHRQRVAAQVQQEPLVLHFGVAP